MNPVPQDIVQLLFTILWTIKKEEAFSVNSFPIAGDVQGLCQVANAIQLRDLDCELHIAALYKNM
jgi:hypothetical protein